MNDRLHISGNVPADRAEVLSDRPVVYWDEQARLDDIAIALEAENERMAAQNAPLWIRDAEFWTDELLDSRLGCVADHLATCMALLQDSINGNSEATTKIHRALHLIEKHAIPLARKQLESIYGSEG